MGTFYLSFADNSKPTGSQWLGACVVEADDAKEAIEEAWRAGCNPGGEVLAFKTSKRPSARFYDRLLTMDDIRELDADIGGPGKAVDTDGNVVEKLNG
jgi:hypothetical protein